MQSLSAAQWVKFGGSLLGMMYQSNCIQVTRMVKALLKWPLLLHTSNSLLGGHGWTGFMNDLERYPHCDWLKTSYSANKVTFCKYAPRTVRAWTPGQHPTTWTVVQPKGNSQFLLSPLERRHQPRPGLREPRPGQPTAGQTFFRKVPAVTTLALPHNATKIQGSCPQRSAEALELSQGRLEALLPSHRSIRREIATSGRT